MYYSIGKFAELIGVSTNTLRTWEKNGRLLPHHRTKGNQRVYSDEQAEEYLSSNNNNKEVTFSFGGGVLQGEPFRDLTREELEQVIEAALKIKRDCRRICK